MPYSRGDYPIERHSPTPKEVEFQGSPPEFVSVDDSDIGSPTQRGAASHRPKDLLLSSLSSLSSSTESLADTTSWSSDGVTGCRVPEPKSTSEPQLAGAAGDRQPEEAIVPRTEPRCRSRSFDGSDRKRPAVAKDRGTGHSTGYHDFDRNQSPSRRSPKSPPRSPSWMRLRESPTRTSCIRTRSPQVSPSEKYPSKLLDEPHHTGLPCSDEYRDYEAYLDERRNPNGNGLETTEGKSGAADDVEDGHSSLHLGNHFFSSSGYEDARESFDLASFAATVASGTAHLTSMSFSPPRPVEPLVNTTGASSSIDRVPDDQLCLPVSSEGRLDESMSSHAEVTTEEHPVGEETDNQKDAADSPGDLLLLASSLSAVEHWSGRFELSPIPDVSPSTDSEEIDRAPSHLVLRRTRSNEDQGAGSYGAKCIAETSPTFGSFGLFRRCPSYHNILALPELEKPEPGAKLPDQTVAIREERSAQVAGVETAALPKLPEEQELSIEEDTTEVEKREETEARSEYASSMEERHREATGDGAITADLNRSQGLFVTGGIDGTRRKNGSFGSNGEDANVDYGAFRIDDKRNGGSMLSGGSMGSGSSMGNVLTADVDEQVFLSDEELREIDLDEELPPKHLLVRKPKKCPPSVTSTLRQVLSVVSPTEDSGLSPAVDEPSGALERKKPDGCSPQEEPGKVSKVTMYFPFKCI